MGHAIKLEPTLVIGTIVAALNGVQTAAIPMPAWAHTVIAVVSIALGAIVNRSQVTPVTAAMPAPPEPVDPQGYGPEQ